MEFENRSSRPFVSSKHLTSATITSDGSNSQTLSTNLANTSQPLYSEPYLAALIAMLEKDGKDNALIHYALAAEMAPENPTAEQQRLMKQVLEEGWDERADALLPYMAQWQEAFAEIYKGAELNYARGIGAEMGQATPVPNFLKAQNAAKMLAVYSRYLESQGKSAQAIDQIATVMAMGRDFNSPDNLMISSLIGIAMQNIGLKQVTALSQSGAFDGQQNNAINLLTQFEQNQASMQQVTKTEMQMMLNGINKALADPGWLKENANNDSESLSQEQLQQFKQQHEDAQKQYVEFFSKPYWDRKELNPDNSEFIKHQLPNFREAEARLLVTKSRSRQQQIDFAAQSYIDDHGTPPRDISILVSNGYLAKAPIDPFTGKGFTYQVTDDGGYDLYGSGPNIITPNDPNVNWKATEGTFSEGVIRLGEL